MILGQLASSYSIKPDLGWMNLTLLLWVAHLISGYPVLGLTRDSGRVLKGAEAVEVVDVKKLEITSAGLLAKLSHKFNIHSSVGNTLCTITEIQVMLQTVSIEG